MLNTIATHNAEGVLDVTAQIENLAKEHYWEIKAQCLEFVTTILTEYSSYSHLLAGKEDLKSGIGAKQIQKPGSGNAGGADRGAIKQALQTSINVIKKIFNTNAPKSVQKLGLFKLQPLLNEFKTLYQGYVEVLVSIEQEIKQIILSEEPIRTGEEIYFSLGTVSFNYKLKSDLDNFDTILLANSLIESIIAQ